jgi:DNA-directed RNA polymerase specialized sigma24 family protein
MSGIDDTVSPDDWALLRAYAQNRTSHEPFARLSAKYAPMVFATALRRTRRHDLAEDVTQAVFIVLARRAGELRREGSLGAWLHRTAILASSEALRAEQRRRKHERRAAVDAAVADDASTTSPDALTQAQDAASLWRMPCGVCAIAIARCWRCAISKAAA